MHVVQDFLDATLCARLRAAAGAGAGLPAPVLKAGIPTVDVKVRRTLRLAIPVEEAALVMDRLEAVRPALQERFDEDALAWDDLQLLTYRPGDYFRPHRDRSTETGQEVTLPRRLAIVIFLNGHGEASCPEADTFDGGALTFYGLIDDPRLRDLGFPLRAETGLLVAFRASVLHEVTPVSRGERHTVVAWLVRSSSHPSPGG